MKLTDKGLIPWTSRYNHPHAMGPILKFKRRLFGFLYKDPICTVKKRKKRVNFTWKIFNFY